MRGCCPCVSRKAAVKTERSTGLAAFFGVQIHSCCVARTMPSLKQSGESWMYIGALEIQENQFWYNGMAISISISMIICINDFSLEPAEVRE